MKCIIKGDNGLVEFPHAVAQVPDSTEGRRALDRSRCVRASRLIVLDCLVHAICFSACLSHPFPKSIACRGVAVVGNCSCGLLEVPNRVVHGVGLHGCLSRFQQVAKGPVVAGFVEVVR